MKFNKIEKSEYIIITCFVIIKLLIHLIADTNWGLDGDEVYHIETGKHLAWGYMTFPPVIGLISWIQNLFHSDSVYIHHLFVHIAASLIYILCGLIMIKLGGGWKAMLLCFSCILAAPIFGIAHNIFQPVIFIHLFWIWGFYYLISYLHKPNDKYLYFIAVILAIAFLTKYSIVFFIGGLLISIIIFQPILLLKRSFWLSSIIFLLIITPNIFWQYKNDFPVFAHFSELYKAQLDQTTFFDNIYMLVWYLNPLTIFIWLAGIFVIPFSREFTKYKLSFFAVSFSFLILLLAKGKFYYTYPIVLICLCLGSIILERFFTYSKRILLYGYIIILLLTSIVAIPFGLTIIPMKTYTKVFQRKGKNDLLTTLIISDYSYKNSWENLLKRLKTVYNELPDKEKKNCIIWGSTYSWASAINLYADKYDIPHAFSFHASHYTWFKEFDRNATIIAVHNTENKQGSVENIKYYLQFFEDVKLKSQILNPFNRNETQNYLNIYVCKGLKHDSKTFKLMMKYHIFN